MASAQRRQNLFTLELLIAAGCEDNHQTLQMVNNLNSISRLWGKEVIFYLEKIINTVKSKSDQLRSVLDFGAPSPNDPATESQTTKTLETKIKSLEEENQRLLLESKKLENEIKALQNENRELKQSKCVIQEKTFRSFLKSYNSKCVELDSQKYETSRNSIWYNEQLIAHHQAKAAMENNLNKKDQKIEELQGRLVTETIQKSIYQDLTEKDSAGKPQHKKPDDSLQLLTFIDPIDKTTSVCPIPMSNGYLISLKHVYNSWKKDGVKHSSIDWNTIPPFKLPGSTDNQTLALPDQILLIHHIALDIGISVEPPFKVQYNMQGQEDGWSDIMLTDQIRIASVMYQMKHTQQEVSKITKYCIVHKTQLLVEVALEQKVFSFKIKETESNPMTEIPSRLVVSDSSYELF